jgi:putative transposase
MNVTTLERNNKIKASIKETFERRKTQTCKVYRIKIQDSSLTALQREQLKMMFVEAKWLVNDILNFSGKVWDYKLQKTVEVKTRNGFQERKLGYLPVSCRQSVLSELQANIKGLSVLKKHGNKVGRLKFRSKVRSINFKQAGVTHKILSGKRIQLQGVKGKLIVNGLKQLPETYELANVKLLNTPKGYYVAITVFIPKATETKAHKPEIGIDMGCETAITISDGRKIRAVIEEPERLKRLQRKAAKQFRMNGKKSSNNRRKTLLLVQREYQKLSDRKNDLANKTVAELLSHERVFMQDEQLAGWKKGGHGKAIQHSILGRVKAKLIQSPRVVVLDRFVPTSKNCECGCLHKDLKLWDRTFVCPACGLTADRDVHAAQNMIRLGKLDSTRLRRLGQGLTEFTPVDTKAAAAASLAEEALAVVSPVGEAGSPRPLGRG